MSDSVIAKRVTEYITKTTQCVKREFSPRKIDNISQIAAALEMMTETVDFESVSFDDDIKNDYWCVSLVTYAVGITKRVYGILEKLLDACDKLSVTQHDERLVIDIRVTDIYRN